MIQPVEEIVLQCNCSSDNNLQLIISALALVVAAASCLIQTILQQKVIKNNTKANRFSSLVELYRLGRLYTSNASGFDEEIGKLCAQIEMGISAEEFSKIYHDQEYAKLRSAVSYFDFLQKMIRDGSLTRTDCYAIVTFPIKLYKNMEPIIGYAKKNQLHDFDFCSRFLDDYVEHMDQTVAARRSQDGGHRKANI